MDRMPHSLSREEYAKVVMDMIVRAPNARFMLVVDNPQNGISTITSDDSPAWFIGIFEMLSDVVSNRREAFRQTINTPESLERLAEEVNNSLKPDTGKAN